MTRGYLGIILIEQSVIRICHKISRHPLPTEWTSLCWDHRYFSPIPKVHLEPAVIVISRHWLPASTNIPVSRFVVQVKPSISRFMGNQPTGGCHWRVRNSITFQSQTSFTNRRLRGWKTYEKISFFLVRLYNTIQSFIYTRDTKELLSAR